MGVRHAVAAALLAVSTGVTAQTAPTAASAVPVAPALQARATGLLAILAGGGDYAAFFTPAFVQSIPETQFRALSTQIQATLGKPLRIAEVTATSAQAAKIVVAYERGTAAMTLEIERDAPNRVGGLLVTGTTLAGDTAAKLQADFQALPGQSGFGIYALDGAAPRPIAEWRGDQPAPLGSAFKLWILAEAARQVAAGTRRWDAVVPLGTPSLPSGISQSWPAGSPVTLHTLATLMISISDNTATDTLLMTLGRERVGAVARETGAAPQSLPVLATREMFVIKSDAALIARWETADARARTAMLAEPAFTQAKLDAAIFGDKPIAVETVEWFASPESMARVMARLAAADPATRAILAANPGTDAATRAKFRYVGFKGGSEPGVITLNFLVERPDGKRLAVTGNWHRADGDTPAFTFLSLMNRALALAAE